MRPTPPSSSSSTPPALGALVVSMLLCALLLGGMASWMLTRASGRPATHDRASVAVVAQTLDPATILKWPEVNLLALAEQVTPRAKMPGANETFIESSSAQALRNLARQINDHQFVTAPVPSIPKNQWQELLERAVSQTRAEVPQDQFLSLGYPVFLACQQGLATLQAALKEGALTWEQAMSDPDFRAHSVYRRNCGNMAAQMHKMGLMDTQARWTSESARVLGLLLGRMRWARMQNIYGPALNQLSTSEQRVYMAWRLGQEDAPSEKLRTLEALLRLDPTYPEVQARTLIALEANDMDYAKALVSRYRNQDPRNAHYRALEAALEEREKSKEQK